MKSVRLLALLLAILLALPAAVMLRSGVAMADASVPTTEELTDHCRDELFDFLMQVAFAAQEGATLEQVLSATPDRAALVTMVKSLFENDDEFDAKFEAAVKDCVVFYRAAITKKI